MKRFFIIQFLFTSFMFSGSVAYADDSHPYTLPESRIETLHQKALQGDREALGILSSMRLNALVDSLDDKANPKKKATYEHLRKISNELDAIAAAKEQAEKEADYAKVSAEDWHTLTTKSDLSGCDKDRNECIAEAASKIIFAPDHMLTLKNDAAGCCDFGADATFVQYAIDAGSEVLPRRLLPLVNEERKAYRMQLSFAAGLYSQAEKLFEELQNKKENGEDSGAIWALTQRGDRQKALKIAARAINWHPKVPPNTFTSAIACDESERSFPGSLGHLVQRSVEKDDEKTATAALELLRQYWDSKIYHEYRNNCASKGAKWAYYRGLRSLMEHYSRNGKVDDAKKIASEIKSRIEQFGGTPYHSPNYQSLVGDFLDAGLYDEAREMARMAKPSPADKHGVSEWEAENDQYLLAAIAWSAKDDTAAFRIAGSLSPAAKLKTLMAFVRISLDKNEHSRAADALAAARPAVDAKNAPLETLDYVRYLFELGHAGEAEAIISAVRQAYDELPHSTFDERSAPLRSSLRYALANEYARRGDYSAAETISKDGERSGPFPRLLYYFASLEKWDEFDKLIKYRTARNTGDDRQELLEDDLLSLLVKKKQHDRAFLLFDTYIQGREYADTRLIKALKVSFRNEYQVPKDVVEGLWARYMKSCYRRREPSAEQRLLQCYAGILDARFEVSPIRSKFP